MIVNSLLLMCNIDINDDDNQSGQVGQAQYLMT